MLKKKTVLVTGGTAKDVPAIAALMLNLKQTNSKLTDDIIVFHDGIRESDQILMNKILPIFFREYNYSGKTEHFNNVIKNYFSTMIFCKYECFNLLNEYRTVLWTDYDVVFNNNINGLLLPTISGFKLMPDISLTVRLMFNNEIKKANIEYYKLDIPGICMSFFIFFDIMKNYNDYYSYCIEKTNLYAQYLYLPEQCIINLLLQDYNIQFESIDFQIYSAHPLRQNITESTKIIHTYGQPKFWNGLFNSTWEKNYDTWVKMGGSKYIHRTFFFKIKKKIKLIFKITAKSAKYILPDYIYSYLKYNIKKILKKNK